MNLPPPPASYDPAYMRALLNLIQQNDVRTHKKLQDIEIGTGQVIWQADTTGVRWALDVTQYGSLRLTNLDTNESRTFYAAEEGTSLPTGGVDSETVYYHTQS